MILNGRIIITMVMLAIFAGMSAMALDYPDKARFLPLLVSVPATLMCLVQLIFDVRSALQDRNAQDSAEAALEHPLGVKMFRWLASIFISIMNFEFLTREVQMFLWLALFFVGIMSFGFLFAAPVLVFAFLRFGEREPWATAILGGLGAWAILYGVFTRLLELFLFEGFLTRLLIG